MRQRTKKKPPSVALPEDRAAEAATVAWMLTMTTTLVCELAAVAGRWYLELRPGSDTIAVLSGLLLFAATASGIFSLILAVVVLRMRPRPPPRGVTVFAVAVGAAPLAIVLVRYLHASGP